MSAPADTARIAYLAPELPALSATFVYEELLAVERRGLEVVPFSVHRPSPSAPGQESLARRTITLYDAWMIPAGLLAALSGGARSRAALRWLVADMRRVGLGRPAAWKLAYQWLAGARLGRMLRRARCTHLHVHFAHVPTQIGMYASAFSGLPFTVMAHANDIFERGLLLPQKAARAAKMLTISRHNVAHLRSVGVAESDIAVVRCGVSFAAPPSVPRQEAKACYRIGTLGRLVEKKGVDVLLRALAQAGDTAWQWELSVAGDGPLRDSLERLAHALGIGERVRFEGALAHAQVTDWLRGLDVFALACKVDANGDMDGIPVVLMEAMSQGVPVLSTRLSGIPELVMDDQTGLLAEPGDAPGLAAQLRRLLESPSLRQRLAQAGMDHVESEFGQSVNTERLLAHFRSAAGRECPSNALTQNP